MIFREAAPHYLAAGLPVIPVSGKAPCVNGWPRFANERVDDDTLRGWLEQHPDANVGLVLGGGLVAVDIDADDLIEPVAAALPPSPWGRVGKKGCVLIFRAAAERKTERIKDVHGRTLVEILASGSQVVLPPSIHPDTGKAYTANADLVDVLHDLPQLPDEVGETLRHVLQDAGYELGRGAAVQWTGTVAAGGRDNALVGLAGRLSHAIRKGERTLLEALAEAQNWAENVPGGQRGPQDADWPVKARAKLMEFFLRDADKYPMPSGWNDGLDDSIKAQLGVQHVADDFCLHEMYFYDANEHLFYSADYPDRESYKAEGIDGLHGRQPVRTKEGGDPTYVRASKYLLEHSPMVKVSGQRFEPGGGRVIKRGAYDYWNVYLSPDVDSDPGDITPVLDHFVYLVPDESERGHLLDWIAWTVQNPGGRINYAVLLVTPEQGTGKGFITTVLQRLVGEQNCATVPAHRLVRDTFNEWLHLTGLVVIEEVMTNGRLSAANKMKEYITAETVSINKKYVASFEAENVAKFFLTSNHLDAMRIDDNDRRYLVIISDVLPKDAAYYNALFEWADDPAKLSKVNWFFMHRDVSHFNPKGQAPKTGSKSKAIAASRGDVEQYLHWMYEAERAPFDRPVVLVRDVVNALRHEDLKGVKPERVMQCLKRLGAKPAQCGQQRLSVGGVPRRECPWVVRDHERWVGASKDDLEAVITGRDEKPGGEEKPSKNSDTQTDPRKSPVCRLVQAV